jgi:hypothetical protein
LPAIALRLLDFFCAPAAGRGFDVRCDAVRRRFEKEKGPLRASISKK